MGPHFFSSSENASVSRPCALKMSTTSRAIKLEVQNDGMDQMRDAIKKRRKGRKEGNYYLKGYSVGKRQRVGQVAMTRYQGSRQKGKAISGKF